MNIARRNVLKWIAGTLLWLIHSNSLAKTCLSDETLKQSLGPFFPDLKDPIYPIREALDPNLQWIEANDNNLTFVKGLKGKAKGQVINLKGRCLDRNCNPVYDAKILLWQASSSGRYNHRGDGNWTKFRDPRDGTLIEREHDPFFQYWGHTKTDADGAYTFKTIIPGFYPADLKSGWFRPPHLHFMVQAKEFLSLTTQTYFGGEHILDHEWIKHLNSLDHILRSKGSLEEQLRLIIRYKPDPKIKNELTGEFDFRLKNSRKIKSLSNIK